MNVPDVEGIFAQTRMNRPGLRVEFGDYSVYLDEGIILMKNNAKGQIDIISNLKLGLKDALSENGRILLSEDVKKEEGGNAGFFILDSGFERAVYVSVTYNANEVQMRSRDYGLGFALSSDFDASASDGALIVIDRKAQRYRITRADGSTLSAGLKLGKDALCFMAARNLAVIADGKHVQVIHGDTRDLIDVGKLAEINGSPLSSPEIGVGFSGDDEWLAVRDKSWKKQCLVIALSGEEKFGYMFCNLGSPFKSGGGAEGLRK